MTVMADRTVRGGQERNRIKTLTQAALNADKEKIGYDETATPVYQQ